MKRKSTKPRNAAERIAEARAAIARLEYTMNQGDNRFGEYGRNCRAAIARWQATIESEKKL
jgi:hypothetical protein